MKTLFIHALALVLVSLSGAAQPKLPDARGNSMSFTNSQDGAGRLRFDGITNRIVRVQRSEDLRTWRDEFEELVDRNGKVFGVPKTKTSGFFRWIDLGAYMRPRITQDIVRSVNLTTGDTLTLTAAGEGSKMELHWFKYEQGQIITLARGTNILRIPGMRPEDSGAYYVSAETPWHSANSSQCTVVVKDPPPPALAPATLMGKTFVVGITSGMRPFMASGTYKFTAASSGNKYLITPLTFIGASSGTYSYKVVSADRATMTIQDSLLNAVTATVEFITPKAGTIEMKKSGSTAYQKGNFVLE